MRTALLLLVLGAFLFPPHLPAQSSQRQYLSGTDKDHTVDWEFFIDRGMNSGQWTTIPVPSNWELQGFGVYNYGRNWPIKQPPSDETGQYRHRFEVPRAWRGQVVQLVFEGVMTDTEVRVNGKPAGPVHQGSFYRFSYDISDLLRYGRPNLLEVTVRNWSANASVNTAEREADYWLFSGIYRPVYLEAHPPAHIQWTAIDARHDGAFRLLAHSQHFGAATALAVQVETLDGEPVGPVLRGSRSPGDTTLTVSGQMAGIASWSPEFPHRYRARVRLLAGEEVLHQRVETFGFRTVELRERDGLYVNDVKVMLKGANRHSFWPESGRCMSPALSVADVQLIKDMNMNAVRMSHYPPDGHFLDACDSLGLFVLDELAGWQTMYDDTTARKLVREMLIRDVNHPSVIIWDNGNEGGGNHAIDDEFHRYDPQQRPLIHPWKKFRGTDTQHYNDYDCCTDGLWHGSRVFFPTEFLHGLYDGGHGAGLEDHWNLMRQNRLAAGGFLWALVDEAVHRRDKADSLDSQGSNAPDGIVGPYREKEGSFFAIQEIWSPVHIPDLYITAAFDGRLPVENRFHYTDLSQCTFHWAWGDFPAPGDPETGIAVGESGQFAGPALAPGDAGWLQLPRLPEDWQRYQVLRLQAQDPHGRVLWTWTWPVQPPAAVFEGLRPAQTGAPAAAQQTETDFTLAAAGRRYRFDRATGRLLAVQVAGQARSLRQDTLLAAGSMVLDTAYLWQDGATQVLTCRSRRDRKETFAEWHWRVGPDGRLGLDMAYLPAQGHYDYLGISFFFPEEKVQGIRYLGQGPYRVWKNRRRGTTLGVWEKAYNNTVTGQDWQYPEFKGYHADLYWAVLETTEGPLRIYSETEGLFLHLFTPDQPQMAYNENTDGLFPTAGNLSFLHAISPIGTKFKAPRQLGPQGQQNMFFYNGRDPEPLRLRIWLEF